MSALTVGLLDVQRLLFDLQRANDIAQRFSGCLDPKAIASRTTDGLIEQFGCAFARIWLVEPDGTALQLVASSGLYTRTDGSFARVPMGAYKVGKIAQNRVSFLSNNLAGESWVKDREWAIANQILGFAGFPLVAGNRVIGVLALFSRSALAPEFLEVLQVLGTMVAVALETALQYQQARPQSTPPGSTPPGWQQLALSDQLAAMVEPARLTLIGTEKPLPLSHLYLVLQVAEVLNQMGCRYFRLVYQTERINLEAQGIDPERMMDVDRATPWQSNIALLRLMALSLGGRLEWDPNPDQQGQPILLTLPHVSVPLQPELCLQIHCRYPIVQLAMTHLAQGAGIQVCGSTQCERTSAAVPLLTDDLTQLSPHRRIIWFRQGHESPPAGVDHSIDLSIQPEHLRAILQGEIIPSRNREESSPLSEREREILGLLAQGLRDRDIAQQLIISESTVKFHVNNVLAKLKAKTRFQALYQAVRQGWV